MSGTDERATILPQAELATEMHARILPKLWRLIDMAKGRPLDVEQELVEAFRQSGLVNEYLLNILPTALLADESSIRSGTFDCGHRRTHAKCTAHVRTDGRRAPRAAVVGSQHLHTTGGAEGTTSIHSGSRTPGRDCFCGSPGPSERNAAPSGQHAHLPHST